MGSPGWLISNQASAFSSRPQLPNYSQSRESRGEQGCSTHWGGQEGGAGWQDLGTYTIWNPREGGDSLRKTVSSGQSLLSGAT